MAELQQLHCQLDSEPLDFQALCESKDAIEFVHPDGHREVFTPDGFKGYFPFTVATAFPAGRTQYGIGIHPETISKHYMTLLHQHSDKDHRMKYNDPKNANAEDKIIGAIVAVSFPRAPNGANAWTINDKPQPAIKGVGVFWKNAAATYSAFANHQMGRLCTVSMDLWYGHDDSGFALANLRNGKPAEFEATTPKEFAEGGWQYVPYLQAPKELRECFTQNAGKKGAEDVIKNYKGQQVTFIAGGLGAGLIAFAGLAVVRYGAEPTAKLGHLVAAYPEKEIMEGLGEMPNLIREAAFHALIKSEAPVETLNSVPAASV